MVDLEDHRYLVEADKASIPVLVLLEPLVTLDGLMAVAVVDHKQMQAQRVPFLAALGLLV
jgi:hypothetical protein